MSEAVNIPDNVAGPDWSSIEREILCPLCGYNLRGLVEPRCPECGHWSTWPELLEEAPPHPFLFEYHDRRNVWSFAKTINETTTPRDFWQSVRPTHPVRVERLIIYWLILFLPVIVVGAAIAAVQLDLHSISRALDVWNYPWRLRSTIVPVLLLSILWPWLSFASLMIYQTTMQRARIHWQHVLRCVIYSADAGLLLGIPMGLLASFLESMIPWRSIPYSPELWLVYVGINANIWFGVLPLICILWYRLDLSYRLYLNFPDARRTVMISQAMVFLASVKICFMFASF